MNPVIAALSPAPVYEVRNRVNHYLRQNFVDGCVCQCGEVTYDAHQRVYLVRLHLIFDAQEPIGMIRPTRDWQQFCDQMSNHLHGATIALPDNYYRGSVVREGVQENHFEKKT